MSRTSLLAALLLFLPTGTARAQSAWGQPEGRTFVQASAQSIGPYDELFREHGKDFRTGREITETSFELYGEHGLAGGWTLVGTLPFRSVEGGSSQGNATIQPVTIEKDDLTALGNVVVGVRKEVAGASFAIAGQLDLELPTGDDDRDSGLATGLDAFTLRPTISVGQGFGEVYAQGYLGLGLRTNDYSDEWRLGGEVGAQVSSDLLLAATVELVDSFENGDVDDLPATRAETGLYVDEQEWLSIGMKGLYQLNDQLGLSLALQGAVSGNNVPKAPFVSIGVTYRL